ncbi:uncharacterized protein LOC108629651 isoform X3 [Ceratina calcarata]|uniref:hydroxyisourate hydrolase n=1 Tax=Ceratina calcarata TaxID=156304 RepID=A0AAJ7NC41_9HYME|nr:uncharacterized protein LOC108629651 isoform X3 [Ceratina calcarata]
MDKMQPSTSTTSDETTVLHANLVTPTGQRLTPTGKISHAKTRVYTQRYRKEWEQMPDFKGWLTSVPFQATRAYCLYCKKNLHAHRLSLLKHTCTMKHQRAALLHEAEEKKKLAARKWKSEDVEIEHVEEVETVEHSQVEIEGTDDDVEYIVERLETDDELDESQIKDPIADPAMEIEDDEDEEEEEAEGMRLGLASDDEGSKSLTKNIKIERIENCEDSLTDSYHMQGEYLDETDTPGGVQMEMVVESEDHSNCETVILSDVEEPVKDTSKDKHENEKSIRRVGAKSDKKQSSQNGKEGASEVVMACPILSTAYQINTSAPPTSTIGVLQPVNAIPIGSAQNKTITLTSGGKTLTLTADQPEGATKGAQVNKDQLAVASTSYQAPKKHVLVKTVKNPIAKRPRISTHVVDTSKGLPIGGLQVSLYKLLDGRWTFLNESNTNPNGRCVDLADNMKGNFTAGRYKIHFDVDKYFTLRRIETMYPFIEIVFDVKNPMGHYHIPVLLSPFGYTTYRGSER